MQSESGIWLQSLLQKAPLFTKQKMQLNRSLKHYQSKDWSVQQLDLLQHIKMERRERERKRTSRQMAPSVSQPTR